MISPLSPEYDDHDLVQSLNELSLEELKEQHKFYYDHPYESATVIYSIKDIPPECNAVIASSHEKPDGTGFPKGLFARQVHALGAAFNTAHAFLDHLYADGFNENSVTVAFLEMDKTFDQGNYQKVYEALKKVFEGRSL
jgi:response regulator RpfG family c-di-GMP phosphodiesterase